MCKVKGFPGALLPCVLCIGLTLPTSCLPGSRSSISCHFNLGEETCNTYFSDWLVLLKRMIPRFYPFAFTLFYNWIFSINSTLSCSTSSEQEPRLCSCAQVATVDSTQHFQHTAGLPWQVGLGVLWWVPLLGFVRNAYNSSPQRPHYFILLETVCECSSLPTSPSKSSWSPLKGLCAPIQCSQQLQWPEGVQISELGL